MPNAQANAMMLEVNERLQNLIESREYQDDENF